MQTQGQQNYSKRPRQSNQGRRDWVREFRDKWITEGIDKEGVDFASELGSFVNKQGLSTSQIRNVFGELKRIQMKGFKNEKTAFILLKPKMAYANTKNDKGGLKELGKIFDKAYSLIDTQQEENGEKQFNNLVNFMEAVLAYHRHYGGK
ncbi:MAG: type III-A CRISPR-associated protein Csm2 [bacterium]